MGDVTRPAVIFPGIAGSAVAGNVSGSQADSDDEDYAQEGYLERSVAGGPFEKVFLELSRDRLRVLSEHPSAAVGGPGKARLLETCLLSTLSSAASLLGEGFPATSRCFKVPLAAGAALVFRCVSERRAAQWVEA